MSLRTKFLVISVAVSAWKRCSVRICPRLFVGGLVLCLWKRKIKKSTFYIFFLKVNYSVCNIYICFGFTWIWLILKLHYHLRTAFIWHAFFLRYNQIWTIQRIWQHRVHNAKKNKHKNKTQHAPNTTTRKQTQTKQTIHQPSHKQQKANTTRTSLPSGNRNGHHKELSTNLALLIATSRNDLVDNLRT
jgi:hypothetical protein